VSEASDAALPWYRVAFGPHYRRLYAARDDAAGAAEAAFAFRATGGGAGRRWLDAACGDGRHAAALAKLGADVYGFDLSPDLLRVARARGLRRLARADLRSPPFAPSAFDAVSLFFTSFGYFDDETNARTFAGLVRLLAPGGALFLDLPDVPRLRASLVPVSETRNELGLCRARRRLRGARVEKEVEIVPADGGEPLRYVESVRLYDADEVRALCAENDLRDVIAFGGYDGRPLGAGDRALYVAKAPA
jgi:SAM-dependent methyltransferase